MPRADLTKLGFSAHGIGEAKLADGERVEVSGTWAFVDWFGEQRPIQIIASNASIPLLGTALLDRHRLTIDYVAKTLTLD